MKAERRHELQTNSLALWIRWRAPEVWQEYGTKILLGVVLLLALVVFIRWRINAPKEAARLTEQDLALADRAVDELRAGARSPADAAQVPETIRAALGRVDEPNLQARGHALLGDYYWTLATLPIPPQAATQPAWRIESTPDDLLAKAEEAFKQVLADKPEQPYLLARAHLGLGAIAETRAFQADRKANWKAPTTNPAWTSAREHYAAVMELTKAPQSLKDEADWHIQQLPRLQKPIWLEQPKPEPTTQPTTQPGTTRPAAASVLPAPRTPPAAPAATRPAK